MLDVEDSLLNSKEVAEILDCSPDTVNELARKNALPAFKRGRQWRFRQRGNTPLKPQPRGNTAARKERHPGGGGSGRGAASPGVPRARGPRTREGEDGPRG